MLKKSKIVLFSSLLASSLYCGKASFADELAPVVAPDVTANPLTSRLRLFGQNGAVAVLFRDSACVKGLMSKDAEVASGSLSSAFGSFLGKVTNTSLGMPDTETTQNLAKRDGIFSKTYFREYSIPADKPASLRMGFQDVSWFYQANGISYNGSSASCRGAISFMPRPGEDYEAAFAWSGSSCILSLNQVIVKDGKTELVPVPVTPAPDC